LPFVAGRSFTVAEEVNRAPVAVLDVQGARLLFGSGSAIGRTVRLGDRDLEVVGLVPTSRWASLSADPERPQVYRPLGFGGSGEISGAVALLRGSAPDPEDLAEALAGIPAAVSQFERVEAEVDVAMSAHRLAEDASLLHWIAATILVFAATFGTFSWLLRARAFEFAVRMALGETESGIRRRVVRATLTIAVASGVLGILIYLPIAYSLRSFLVTTNPLAPSALAEAAMAVAGVTVAAGLLAMRQISHGISPDVLREGARRTAL